MDFIINQPQHLDVGDIVCQLKDDQNWKSNSCIRRDRRSAKLIIVENLLLLLLIVKDGRVDSYDW